MSTQTQRYPSLSHWGAFTAVVRNGRLVACEPFAADPAPSSILDSLPGMVHSPLRIRQPAVRQSWLKHRNRAQGALRGSEPFVEVSWDQALRLVADELARVRTEHGATGIFGGSYGWSSAGRLHHARTQTHRFLHAGGGCVNQVGNYSWGTAQFLLPHVIGVYAPVIGRVTNWNSVIAHTRLLIAFGGIPLRNTQVTSGGAGLHLTREWLKRYEQSGGELVVISPSRRDVPEGCKARFIPIRPNTDAALMLGMIHTLLEADLHDKAFLSTYCTGFEHLEAYLRGDTDGVPKNAAWAAERCGIPTETIRALALQAAATRTLTTCTWALQRAHHGEQPYWSVIALTAALGQIGLPGGGFSFGHGSMNAVGNPRLSIGTVEMAGLPNPAKSTIPVARMADMLLHPGQSYVFDGVEKTYPDIRLVYWAGGNPFHHHQDLNRLQRAWSRPETIVVHDSWWTPTARRADIVLPATTTLERNDLGGSSLDAFVFAMHQALPPQGQSRSDFDIYRELAAMGGFEDVFAEGRNEAQWLRHIYDGMAEKWRAAGVDAPAFEAFWEQGYVQVPETKQDFILFEDFRRDPQAHPLKTPSGRIELYSERIAGFGYDDMLPHPAWLPPVEWLGADLAQRFPLHLLTPQPAGKLHSQLDAGQASVATKLKGREPVLISPQDAQARDIADGDVVRIFNDRGACLACAVVSSDIMPGVISMSTGAWFDPQEDGLERHGNPNVLTRDIGACSLTQGTSAQSALVEVERWHGEAPPVRAFEVPELIALETPELLADVALEA